MTEISAFVLLQLCRFVVFLFGGPLVENMTLEWMDGGDTTHYYPQ